MTFRNIPTCGICDDYFLPPHRRRVRFCRECRPIASNNRVKSWALRHPKEAREKQKSRSHRCWARHRDRKRAESKARYWSNVEASRAYARQWSQGHKAEIQAHRRKRYATNPEYRLKALSASRARQSKIILGKSDVNLVIQHLAKKKSAKCFYCHKRLSIRKIHLDHVKPLALGGEHTAFNIVTSCPSCNCHKRSKHPNDFIKSGQLLLIY